MDITALNQPILLFIDKNGMLVPAPGLQPGYGPHASLAAAQTALAAAFDGSISKVPQGYTFCVIENNKPVEYWLTKAGDWASKERKNVSTSQSSDQTNYLGRIAMKVADDNFLYFSIDGGVTWNKVVGPVRQAADFNQIQLGIVNGQLFITRDGSSPTDPDNPSRSLIGDIGGEGMVIQGTTTYLKFAEDGTLLVRYGEQGDYNPVTNTQYQGKRINEDVFRNLLKKYFKIALIEDFIKYSYDGGATWTPLHKISDEAITPTPSGNDRYRVTFKVYYNGSVNEYRDATQLVVDGNYGVVGDIDGGGSMYLEDGEHYVTATCTGYHTKTVNFTVNGSSTQVEIVLERDESVPTCRFSVRVLDDYGADITSPAHIFLNGKETDAITIFSGASVTVRVTYPNYIEYLNTYYNITSNTTEEIQLTPESGYQESEWTYHVINGLDGHPLVHLALIDNDGQEGVGHYVTAYRQHKTTAVRERLQLVRVYNPDGDPNGQNLLAANSLRPTTVSDQIHSDYSYFMYLDFPAGEAQYMHEGYKYQVDFEWMDNDGNTVTSKDEWYYEGFWERHIEMYAQDVYVDNVAGGKVVLRVDSYCVKDDACPGDNHYIYPCPLELIPQSGITQLARNYKYLDWTANPDWPDWSVEHDDYGHGSYAEIRNVFTLQIANPTSGVSGVQIDPDTGNYIIPVSFRQFKQQNPLYMFQENADREFQPADLITGSVEIECRTHQVTGTSRAAVGDLAITKDTFVGLMPNQKEFRTLFLKCVYREQAGSSAESSLTFCGANIEITAPGGVPLYSAKLTPNDGYYGFSLSNEQFASDDYIIDIECKREYQSTAPKGPNKNIEIRFCHVHNYVQNRVYTVRVTPFGGATTEFTFTLEAVTLNDGVALYPIQYIDTYNAGSAYFGIVGNHAADIMNADVDPVGTSPSRSNRDQITVTPVSASELPAALKPMGGRGDNYVLNIDEPFRVDNSVTVTWFRVDFPEVPQTSEDIAVNACKIYVLDEDMPGSNWVFQGEQKKP